MNLFSYFISTPRKVGFDDILFAIRHTPKYLILNTLSPHEQDYLIQSTVSCLLEEKLINELMQSSERDKFTIILYGKNALDETVERKYHQIRDLGFSKDQVFIYPGGLFEWCLLQDIHGSELFPTVGKCIDILKYKPGRVLGESFMNTSLIKMF